MSAIGSKKSVADRSPVKMAVCHAVIFFCIAVYAFVFRCPLRILTGVCCPGCGLTRAWLSVLRLDFRAAFYYHPFFWLLPPLLFFFIHRRPFRLPGSNKAWNVSIAIACVLMLALYIYRLISGSPVVYIDIESGLIYRLFNSIAP